MSIKENNLINNSEFYPKDFYYLNYDYNHKSMENKVFLYKIQKILFDDTKSIISITTFQEKYFSDNIKKISKFIIFIKFLQKIILQIFHIFFFLIPANNL